MNSPTVSFVVPCHRLAHLLPECIHSILAQTYSDFEVLIMDDCSPDNTPDVAASFDDPRVKYVRNEHNLGHLRNYNKGIELSRGKYVWLISADDYLRQPYILERYVSLMDSHPQVGFTFCPGVGVTGNSAGASLEYTFYRPYDVVVNGHVFLEELLNLNIVLAPSAIVRRECYDRLGLFPLNAMWAGQPVEMGWAGDWYLWCLFSLFFDVGYFAEPMVCYRLHNLSMTDALTQRHKVDSCAAADIAIPWLIRQRALECGIQDVARHSLKAIAHQYARQLSSTQYRSATSRMSVEQFEESLSRSTPSETDRNWIRARVFSAVADALFAQGDLAEAKRFYVLALKRNPGMLRTVTKLILLCSGAPGRMIRRIIRTLSRKATGAPLTSG